MALLVDEPGLQSTVQDLGRPGHYDVGIPPGGALDTLSHEIANLLVGNPGTYATIETTYTAPTFTVTAATVMAVTGAAMKVKVNGSSVPQWTAVPLHEGDVVSFGFATAGTRTYLAFAGGIDVPVVLGSRSTYALGKIGGLHGRALSSGDTVPLGTERAGVTHLALADNLRPRFAREATVRVVVGLYAHLLTTDSLDMLTSAEFKLTPLADRTGFRFQGAEPFTFEEREQPFGAGSDPSNIVDAGYPVGSIQLPGGNQPIVLHRDAVSAGGYAMVATVISADMNVLAQLAPGSTAVFEAVSIDQALAARTDAAARRGMIRRALSA
ncbi:allophanate hydrolase [Rhodococcus sp. Leaf7]|uniref:5-oxoprolinase subunit C family protein n=1 Tax=unclassified Rhodococcus (in: high G+C Gram-positive bacteria) TaxID=192944 RepID=UPI0006FDE5A5|nr:MULTISPECIES: biotin-dependent carboxyltransferase family protein [unclassified Rhodococcus (in: high G+C Gram-positive bacteria)]KQU01928.1 allophanate hydrolase [Rhodococcus sp. Leaf7]KQU38221.1 allophanate hydrolase [Rhodococcus sp. Leaf247]